jgi:predicted RNA-binding protein (virulence factor B family)
MINIGKINELKVVKEVDFGVYLDGQDFDDILMPKRYVPENCKIDDLIEVFVYCDSEDRLVATTEEPYATVGDFAFLKVKSVNSFGAFMEWGLLKDLLVPFREQKMDMEEGKSYLVYIYLDLETNRIAASSKVDKFIKDGSSENFNPGQEVDLLIFSITDIGYKALINGSFQGILYKNEVFGQLEKGQQLKGFIKLVREDGKIDLTLHKFGYNKVSDFSEHLLSAIKDNNGRIEITDKSPSEDIYEMFGVSKKTFKKAVGSLYKKRLIKIEKDYIKLAE